MSHRRIADNIYLVDDVLLNSKVISTDRSGKDVKVLVQTPKGVKLVLAKKIVISIPPLLSNLAGFDLYDTERSLFSQFTSGAYYTGLIRHAGIPDDVVITAVGANTSYNLPQGMIACPATSYPRPSLFAEGKKKPNLTSNPISTHPIRHHLHPAPRPQRR